MRHLILAGVLLLPTALSAGTVMPTPGSPGHAGHALVAPDRCPTFSWGALAGATGYQLAVYGLVAGEVQPEPTLLHRLPAGITSWTPSLDECFTRGTDYAWLVRAHTESGWTDWSRALLFRTPSRPSPGDVEQALATLRAYAAEAASGVPGGPLPSGFPNAAAPVIDVAAPPSSGARRTAPLSPDAVAMRAELADTTGVNVGLLGSVASSEASSAGVVGEATAVSGDVVGVLGRTASPAGAAGLFETDAGSDLLRGVANSVPVFVVGSSGGVAATSFSGEGSNLTGVDAVLLDGQDSSAFASAAAHALHLADTANPHQVTASQTGPATAKGDLEVHDGGGIVRLPAGTDGQVLKADAAAPSGLGWQDEAGGGVPAGESCTPGYSLAGFDSLGELLCRGGDLENHYSNINGTLEGLAVAIGADGRPVLAQVDVLSDGEVYFSRCSDDLCSTLETTFVGTLSTDYFVDIAVGSDQLPIVVFNNAMGLVALHCDDAACASRTTSVVDAFGGIYPSLAIGSDGLPVIAYTRGDLKVAHCTAVDCSSRSLETVAVGSISSPSVAIASPNPIIAYRDDVQTRLMFAACDNTSCSSAQIKEVDNSADTGQNPSLALGGDSLPLISYDTGGSALKVAHCTDPSCAGRALAFVASGGSVAAVSSLVIGVDGLPLIAYRVDQTAFMVARCNDGSCTEASRIVIDDSVSNHLDVAIGDDGLPFVAWDSAGVSTRHCGSPNCS